MKHQTKNYSTPDEFVVGGKITVVNGGEIDMKPGAGFTGGIASEETAGVVKVGSTLTIDGDGVLDVNPANAVSDGTAAGESDDKVKLSDFNALLTVLRNAGYIAEPTLEGN